MTSSIVRGEGPGVGMDKIYAPLRGHKSGDYSLKFLHEITEEGDIDLDPPYQRGHVWGEVQQSQFVGFLLEGGISPAYFWREYDTAYSVRPYEVIDGKQRITALLRWWRGEILGVLSEEFKRRAIHVQDLSLPELRRASHNLRVTVQILVNITDAQVLRFYMRLNRGGTLHTDAEIARVQKLYDAEMAKGIDS